MGDIVPGMPYPHTSSTESYKHKQHILESQSYGQERAVPWTPPIPSMKSENNVFRESEEAKGQQQADTGTSMVLAASAADLTEQILTAGLEQIRAAGLEQQIDQHYYQTAEKIFAKLWRTCRKTTGHKMRANGAFDQDTCAHCGFPTGEGVTARKRQGITALAEKLRRADKEAGVEWIPS